MKPKKAKMRSSHHTPAHPHLHRPKMSTIGKSAYAGAPAMAFPGGAGGGMPAFPPDPNAGAGPAAPMPMMPPGPGGL